MPPITASHVPLTLAGQRHGLLLTLDALAHAGEQLQVNLLHDARPLGRPTIREARVLTWACLLHEDDGLAHDPPGAMAWLGAQITPQAMPAMLGALNKAILAGLPEPTPGPADTDRSPTLTWHELEAMGRVDLGLGESEFWRLTLRQFAALAERARERERRADLRAGVVASLIFNANRGKSRALSAPDFFPSLIPTPNAKRDSNALAKKAVAITNLLGGTVVRREKPIGPRAQGRVKP